MGDLHLSEPLQRYFLDFFLCFDDKKSGKVHVNKLIELMKSGGLAEDIITQISNVCYLESTKYLNRKQFCSALKLVAAHQANLPINPDVLTSAIVELPVPRLKWPVPVDTTTAVVTTESSMELLQEVNNCVPPDEVSDLIELHSEDRLAEYREHVDAASSTDSEVDSETLSIGRNGGGGGSPGSTASDSPTPTNSVQDRSWAVSGHWQQGLLSEEQRQLLGTEEESSDRHSSEDDATTADMSSSAEVLTITREQKEYYTAQFRTLQPDIHALLPGPVARKFFEMSRLPVQELRRIWTLADVTRDGALSLSEFSVAMHLVVLRRNHIELPTVLPPELLPPAVIPPSVSATSVLTDGSSVGGIGTSSDERSTAIVLAPSGGGSGGSSSIGGVSGSLVGDEDTEPMLSSPPPAPLRTKDGAREWTKFAESPTGSVASPGPKPVNFDFQKCAVEKDPKIHHPVALRLTPEVTSSNNKHSGESEEDREGSSSPKPFLDIVDLNNKPVNNNSNNHNSTAAVIIQRPQPKKLHLPASIPGALPPPPIPVIGNSITTGMEDGGGNCGPVSLPAFPPPKKDKPLPPPPPPRPFKTHGRSSSLDLNRLNKQQQQQQQLAAPMAPPTVPPRVSPNVQQQQHATGKKLVNQRSEGDCIPPSTHHQQTHPPQQQQAQNSVAVQPFANFDNFESYENVDSTDYSSNPGNSEEVDGIGGIFPGERYEAERRKLFAQFAIGGGGRQQSGGIGQSGGGIGQQQGGGIIGQQSVGGIGQQGGEIQTGGGGGQQQQDESGIIVDGGSVVRKHGAFEIYRKPTTPRSRESPAVMAGGEDMGKYELFVKLQEQNTVLLRLCQELSQELADVREQKLALKVKLEKQNSGAG